MDMSWKVKTLRRVVQGDNIHTMERNELIEDRLIAFGDNPSESLELTDRGLALVAYADSPDFASKRQ